jgi:hypothetical protein
MGRFATAAFPLALECKRDTFHRLLCGSLLKGGKSEDKADSGWPQGILRKSRNLDTDGFEPVRAFSIMLGGIQKACQVHPSIGIGKRKRKQKFGSGFNECL